MPLLDKTKKNFVQFFKKDARHSPEQMHRLHLKLSDYIIKYRVKGMSIAPFFTKTKSNKIHVSIWSNIQVFNNKSGL